MKTKTGNKIPKRATKGTKSPHENQAYEIELILSQKQERATKSTIKQRTADGNAAQKPKRATKSNKEHFSFPFSFLFSFIVIHLLQLWTCGEWLTSRAWKSQKEQQQAMKSNKKQQKVMKSNKKQKRTLELEKPKGAIKKPK